MSRSALILRHSSRAARIAHSDRYSLIRSFFSSPSPLSTRPALLSPPALAIRRNSCIRDNHPATYTTRQNPGPQPQQQKPCSNQHITSDGLPPDIPSSSLHDNYPRFFRRLAQSLPHVSRPTRDDFLNAANGMVQRMRVRVRWFFIRNFRKFNSDDISAFVTWFLVGQGLWILIGTSVGIVTYSCPRSLSYFSRTTFFSAVFAVTNSLRLQCICGCSSYDITGLKLYYIAYVARAISDYLTSETGVTIIFESAIVPKWKDSRISFKNVYITRRPKSDANKLDKTGRGVYAVALGYDVSNHPANHTIDDEEDYTVKHQHSDQDIKWSMFDLSVDSIDVTLSLWRWLDGKGLVKDAVVKGVRGVLGAHLLSVFRIFSSTLSARPSFGPVVS